VRTKARDRAKDIREDAMKGETNGGFFSLDALNEIRKPYVELISKFKDIADS